LLELSRGMSMSTHSKYQIHISIKCIIIKKSKSYTYEWSLLN
jgi:hypothetical protein